MGAKANQPVATVVSPQTVSVTLEGLKISGGRGECIDSQRLLCPHGVLVAGKARLFILSCEISDNVACGLFATGEAEVTAIRLSASGNSSGVWAHAQAKVSLQDATIFGNDYGLIATGKAKLAVEGCTVSDNDRDGVLIADGAKVYLRSICGTAKSQGMAGWGCA